MIYRIMMCYNILIISRLDRYLNVFQSGKSEKILPNYLMESTRQSACFVVRSRVNVREQSRVAEYVWRGCSP